MITNTSSTSNNDVVNSSIQLVKLRKQNILQVLIQTLHHLFKVLFTNIFQVFDHYFQHNGMEIGHINVLTMQHIKVNGFTLDFFENTKKSHGGTNERVHLFNYAHEATKQSVGLHFMFREKGLDQIYQISA